MEKKKILIVDDEPDLVEMMKMRLLANNYDVVCAYDGAAGLDMAKKENPDLIILDLMLPKMDGYKVCGLLKMDIRYKKIPIIMFTARAQESDKKQAEDVGVDAYISKPFELKLVVEKINEFLKQTQ